MFFLKGIHKQFDLSLFGVLLVGIGAICARYLAVHNGDTGAIGRCVSAVLFCLFAKFCWMAPLLFACIGVMLIFDSREYRIASLMTYAGICYLLLFATMYQSGLVGKAIAHMLHMLFGDFRRDVLSATLALLSYAISGFSVREALAGIGHVLRGLWEIRLPSWKPQQGEAPELVALPVVREEIIEAEFAEPYEQPQAQEAPAPVAKPIVPHAPSPYVLPPLSLFSAPKPYQVIHTEGHEQKIADALSSFGIGVETKHKEVGPSVTRYELKLDDGVKIAKIDNLTRDLAMRLAVSSVRVEDYVPGKSVIGVEIPNAHPSIVTIREILDALPMDGSLSMALGKDITGNPVIADLREMPHLLVAGATNTGKSVCLNSIIASFLVSSTPDQVQMLFIDPKRVELSLYDGIPHLIRPVITDKSEAANALEEVLKIMDARYELFREKRVRKLEEHNQLFPESRLPYIVVVIDELFDLMSGHKKQVEPAIERLAAVARATGIHLIIATQRPVKEVVTGLIKSNVPSRIALAVRAELDSRIILDRGGAEKLIGRGDMLFQPMDASKPMRVQGALITGAEVSRLVAHWSAQEQPQNIVELPLKAVKGSSDTDRCFEAASFAIELGYASTAKMQERFQIGHPRATKLMQELEARGVIGPREGNKPRAVLMTEEELKKSFHKDAALC